MIVGPDGAAPAFRLGDKTDDPVQMYLNDIFTIAANLTGAPAISIPCGFDRGGLPIGLQLQGDSLRRGAPARTSRTGTSRRPTGTLRAAAAESGAMA